MEVTEIGYENVDGIYPPVDSDHSGSRVNEQLSLSTSEQGIHLRSCCTRRWDVSELPTPANLLFIPR